MADGNNKDTAEKDIKARDIREKDIKEIDFKKIANYIKESIDSGVDYRKFEINLHSEENLKKLNDALNDVGAGFRADISGKLRKVPIRDIERRDDGFPEKNKIDIRETAGGIKDHVDKNISKEDFPKKEGVSDNGRERYTVFGRPEKEPDVDSDKIDKRSIDDRDNAFPPPTLTRVIMKDGDSYWDDSVGIFVAPDVSPLLNNEDKLLGEIAKESELTDLEKGGHRLNDAFIIEPSKDSPNLVNVYRIDVRTLEDSLKAKDHERNLPEVSVASQEKAKAGTKSTADRLADKGSETLKRLSEKVKVILTKVKENIALGAAVTFIMEHGGPVKTMDDIKKRDGVYKVIKEKLEKVRSALKLDRPNEKTGADKDL